MLLIPSVGALLLVALSVGHSTLGEKFVLRPLFAQQLPPFMGSRRGMQVTLRASWHLIDIAWLGFGALLLQAAVAGPSTVGATALWVTTATLGATGAAILVVSRGRHAAWVGFTAAAGCAWWTVP